MGRYKWIFISLCFIILLCSFWKQAATAKESDSAFFVEVNNFSSANALMDKNRTTTSLSEAGGEILLSVADKISYVYIEFDTFPDTYSVVENGSGITMEYGTNGYLHQCIDVESVFGRITDSIKLVFDKETVIADIYVFSNRKLPDWVQIWEPPCKEADLLLVSSHADDEQLFFAGILPLYGGERKLNVQVAYTVQHHQGNGFENYQRTHEQLDGLWKVGIKNYPFMSTFPDLYSEGKDEQDAFQNGLEAYEKAGVSYKDFVEYFKTCIRKCKPLVVVSHDLKGEYGHGTHIITARALAEAVVSAAKEEEDDSASTWQAEKLYLHLYDKNQVVIDFDVPLKSFGGKTAFQVSQEGFDCHKSQHWTWFYKWIYGTGQMPITRADEITTYSPNQYGLYFSTVGWDKNKDDFFENIETYLERELREYRQAQEKRIISL